MSELRIMIWPELQENGKFILWKSFNFHKSEETKVMASIKNIFPSAKFDISYIVWKNTNDLYDPVIDVFFVSFEDAADENYFRLIMNEGIEVENLYERN